MSMIDKDAYIESKGLTCPFCGAGPVEGGFTPCFDLITQQIAAGKAVIPVILGLQVFLVDKTALDLHVFVGILFPALLTGRGPVPVSLGGLLYGHLGNMASLARQRVCVRVDPGVCMQFWHMTVGTGNLIFVVYTDRN